MQGIAGQVFVVTGGAQGIGRATAEALLAAGGRVALADVRAEAAFETARALDASGVRAIGVAMDVRDAGATERAMAQVETALGPIAGLVTSAGTAASARAEEMPLETWQRVIEINLTGTFLSAQAAGRRMLARGRGSIVTIASLTGLGGQSGRANYSSSKWGVIGLTRTLAVEWGRRGVRVNCIAPNLIDTPLAMLGVPHDFIRGVIVDRTPMGRIGQPAEIAAAAVFLLSDAASYVNGAMLPVDGGISAGYVTHQHGEHFGSNAIPGQRVGL